jgi:hypothetical protein
VSVSECERVGHTTVDACDTVNECHTLVVVRQGHGWETRGAAAALSGTSALTLARITTPHVCAAGPAEDMDSVITRFKGLARTRSNILTRAGVTDAFEN